MGRNMLGLKKMDAIFVGWAFFLQIALIIHFALRKPFFESYTLQFGWIIYALCIPAAIISIVLLKGGKSWSFWLGGFLFVIFAIYGYYVDYVQHIPWRNPLMLRIMFPYVTLYLATIMFYWWSLALISRPLWFVYAFLFIISTTLNVFSH